MSITLDSCIERAKGLHSCVAVAGAHDEDVLSAVIAARRAGICDALLVGHERRIRALLEQLGERADAFVMMDGGEDDDACAQLAIEAVVSGRAHFLMKGMLPTATLLKRVVRSPLRGERLLSHVMLYELPAYDHLLVNTDGGMNPAPDLERKAMILENAARFLRAIGYPSVVAACISGSEVVSDKIPSTCDGKALASMDWSHLNMTVFGPVGLDLAVSPEAARHKRYEAAGAGRADILLMPNYEAGNCFGKALTYFAGARSAGLVIGAKTPIVLTSRADTAETKTASLALGTIAAKGDTF